MTAKSREDLNGAADTDLADNTSGAITPAKVRGLIKDLADSALNVVDDGKFVVLTASEYDGLSPPVDGTIYFVTA